MDGLTGSQTLSKRVGHHGNRFVTSQINYIEQNTDIFNQCILPQTSSDK